jgi:hypothetical protein
MHLRRSTILHRASKGQGHKTQHGYGKQWPNVLNLDMYLSVIHNHVIGSFQFNLISREGSVRLIYGPPCVSYINTSTQPSLETIIALHTCNKAIEGAGHFLTSFEACVRDGTGWPSR